MRKEAKKLINITDSKKEPPKEFMKRKPSVIFKNNLRIKKQIEKALWKRKKRGISEAMEVIIRDIARANVYPEIDRSSGGISPWFKAEIKGLYYRGLEVFISSPEYVFFDKNKQSWRFANVKKKDKIIAFPVGRIPFDNIIDINWDGDEYYRSPHIYCDFRNNGPYESIIFYGYREDDEHYPYFELEGFNPYNKKGVSK